MTTPAPAMPLATPPRSSPPAAVTGHPADALVALIKAEREASMTGDSALLIQLWSPDARIVDGRNTESPADDYVWAGRDAIMDRYRVAVFPNPPPPLDEPDVRANLIVDVDGETVATGINGGDHWRLIYADGRWWLRELIYQQP